MLRRAQGHYDQKQYKEAVEIYTKIVAEHAEHPKAPEAQYKKAMTCETMGDLDKAAEEWVKLCYRYPDSEQKYAEGISHIKEILHAKGKGRQLQTTNANNSVDESLSRQKPELMKFTMPDIELNFRKAAVEEGAKDELVRIFAESRKSPATKDEVDAIWSQALNAIEHKHYQQAIDFFMQINREYPNHRRTPISIYLAGLCQMKLENWKTANETFDILVLQKRYPVKLEDWNAADPRLNAPFNAREEAKRLRPEAMYWLGESWTKMNDYRKGDQVFQALIGDYPESPWAKYARGRLTQQDFKGLDARSDK